MYRLGLVILFACGSTSRPPVESRVPIEKPVAKPKPSLATGETAAWIEKLSDPHQAELAITELEQLGDPAAIDALGAYFISVHEPRVLRVIVSLARPLTAADAKAKLITRYETTGRAASWTAAKPYLEGALAGAGDSPKSSDAAMIAADAIAEGGLRSLGPLASLASRPTARAQIAAQIAAIRAIGTQSADKPRAIAVLGKVIARPSPKRSATDDYAMHEGVIAAAVNALSALHDPAAIPILMPLPLRMPELMTQIRRAFVASGRSSIPALRKMLRGEDAAINQQIKAGKLDRYCGDDGNTPAAQCMQVAPAQFYAALLLGDLHATEAAGDLLAELGRPPVPAYFVDDQAGSTQHAAASDALRKLGVADTAAGLRAIWIKPATPLETRVAAIGAYGFVARDTTGVAELGKISFDNTADDTLRTEAILAYGRLGREAALIPPVFVQAQKYVDASIKNQKIADRERPKLAAADKTKLAAQQALDAANADLRAKAADPNASTADIKAATERAKKADETNRLAKTKYKEDTGAFHTAERMARDYLKYARMFQLHAARIDLAITCKSDPACYAATLKWTKADAATKFSKRLPDAEVWPTDDRQELLEAYIERAMLELGKLGDKAVPAVDAMLAAVASEQRVVRQSILLALPKIVATPCDKCVTALDAAIAAGEGKTTLGDLQLETQIARGYFAP